MANKILTSKGWKSILKKEEAAVEAKPEELTEANIGDSHHYDDQAHEDHYDKIFGRHHHAFCNALENARIHIHNLKSLARKHGADPAVYDHLHKHLDNLLDQNDDAHMSSVHGAKPLKLFLKDPHARWGKKWNVKEEALNEFKLDGQGNPMHPADEPSEHHKAIFNVLKKHGFKHAGTRHHENDPDHEYPQVHDFEAKGKNGETHYASVYGHESDGAIGVEHCHDDFSTGDLHYIPVVHGEHHELDKHMKEHGPNR